MKNDFCQIMFYRGCSNRCGPRCTVPDRKSEVSAEHLRALITSMEILHEEGFKRVELIGGEPLDYPHLSQVIQSGNQLSIERFVLITTGINEGKMREVAKSADSEKWGFCFTVDLLPDEARKFLSDPILGGIAKKANAGWKALENYRGWWRRGHVTVGRHNLRNLPYLAWRIMELGAYFNCCPVMSARNGNGLVFEFRSASPTFETLKPEDKFLAEEVVAELKEMKRKYGALFLPSEEYLDLIPLCCKENWEKYPSSCGEEMPYLRLGDRIADDGTLELMVCSDFYLEQRNPRFGVNNWSEDKEEIESLWKANNNRLVCQSCEGCVWSVSLILRKASEIRA